MKLTELKPKFLNWTNNTHFHYVNNINEADGIIFLCPTCLAKNNNDSMGVHSIICWEPNIPQTTSPKPGRWKLNGTGFNDLTLTASSNSISLPDDNGCKAHFFITNGEIVNAG